MANRPVLPAPVLALVAAYFLASLAHFTHNAEYIAFYPGLPRWIDRQTVYVAWLGITGIGIAAAILFRLKRPMLALLFLGIYGAFGLDGLLHYTLALCSEHTLAANVTIWSEASTGLVLLLVSTVLFTRRLRA